MRSWVWLAVVALGAVAVFAVASKGPQGEQPAARMEQVKDRTQDVLADAQQQTKGVLNEATREADRALETAKKETADAWDAAQRQADDSPAVVRQEAQQARAQTEDAINDASQRIDQQLGAVRERTQAQLSDARETVRTQTAQVTDAAADRLDELEKTTYERTMQDRIKTYDTRIGSLKDRADQIPSEVRAELAALIDGAKRQLDVARNRLQEVQEADAQQWNTAKSGLEDAVRQLEQTIQQADSRLAQART